MSIITIQTPLGTKTIKTVNGQSTQPCNTLSNCSNTNTRNQVQTPLGVKTIKSNNQSCPPAPNVIIPQCDPCHPCQPSQACPTPMPPSSDISIFTIFPLTGGGQLDQDRTFRLAISEDSGNAISVHPDGLFAASGGSGDLFAKVVLTASEVKNLLTTPQVLLPADAATFFIPTLIIISNPTTKDQEAYSFTDPTVFSINTNTAQYFFFSQDFANALHSYIVIPSPQGQFSNAAPPPINSSLIIQASNDSPTGEADWTFYIYYKAVTP